MNLRVIEYMKEVYPEACIGFSCHFNGIHMAQQAYVLGARIIEKHFTLNHTFKGTDHALSLEPQGLQSLCRNLHDMHEGFGSPVKEVHESEKAPIRKMSQSVYAKVDIDAGAIIFENDIELRTPADGLPAWEFNNIIGKTCVRPCKAGALIEREDYE